MKTSFRALALVTTAVVGLGLTACSSGSDGAADHDHSAHDGGAAMHHEAGPQMTEMTPSADYPLTTCVVSGEALGGEMGDAIAYEVDGVEVQFCCAGCVDEFKESPDEFLAKVRAANAR